MFTTLSFWLLQCLKLVWETVDGCLWNHFPRFYLYLHIPCTCWQERCFQKSQARNVQARYVKEYIYVEGCVSVMSFEVLVTMLQRVCIHCKMRKWSARPRFIAIQLKRQQTQTRAPNIHDLFSCWQWHSCLLNCKQPICQDHFQHLACFSHSCLR